MLMGLALLLAVPSIAQVDLINKVKDNQSDNAKEGFQWESVVDVERLAVENQGASGTCWSYSTNSFLESEMARMLRRCFLTEMNCRGNWLRQLLR